MTSADAVQDRRPKRGRSAARLVTDAMSSPVIGVSHFSTLADALRALSAARVRHLVVVGDDPRCPAILSDRAVAAAWARDPLDFATTAVTAALDGATPTVPMTATVADAAHSMQEQHTDATIVLDQAGRVRGIVTATDLVAILAGRR